MAKWRWLRLSTNTNSFPSQFRPFGSSRPLNAMISLGHQLIVRVQVCHDAFVPYRFCSPLGFLLLDGRLARRSAPFLLKRVHRRLTNPSYRSEISRSSTQMATLR